MKLREQPVRLERYLERDYINPSQKMAEIERYMRGRVISPMELTAYWVVLGIFVTWALLAWEEGSMGEEKIRGWRLVAIWAGAIVGSWAISLLVIYGIVWVLQ